MTIVQLVLSKVRTYYENSSKENVWLFSIICRLLSLPSDEDKRAILVYYLLEGSEHSLLSSLRHVIRHQKEWSQQIEHWEYLYLKERVIMFEECQPFEAFVMKLTKKVM